jgi:hypothetical protein
VTIITLKNLPSVHEFDTSPFDNHQTSDHDESQHDDSINRFPISINEDPFESIVHPATEIIPSLSLPNLTVPVFYDPPQFEKYGGIRSFLGYGDTLMTPEQAQMIGSKMNGKETIFISIASYRDYQCRQTVETIFLHATYPERIRVAVVDQIDKTVDSPCSEPQELCSKDPTQVLCKYKNQIDFYTMEAKYAMGPVFARHLGHRLYRGEYFAAQSDAHVDFILDWDTKIISDWKHAKNEMAVLTTYLSDVTDRMDSEGHSLADTRPIMCRSDFEDTGPRSHLRHGQQPEGPAGIKGEPTLEPFWAAGFSFGRGHFVINIPYDQHLPWVFQGEEISIGLRGFTYGYDYYTPEQSVCFHYYAKQDNTGLRKKVKLFWENQKEFGQHNIKKIEVSGMRRLNGIIGMGEKNLDPSQDWIHTDEKKYGIGKVRSVQKFFDTFGIHLDSRTVEDKLCQFVGRNMQRIWKPHLRKNRMGINYDEIKFRFRNPETSGFGTNWKKYIEK